MGLHCLLPGVCAPSRIFSLHYRQYSSHPGLIPSRPPTLSHPDRIGLPSCDAYICCPFSCVNAVGISWAGINAQGYVTATTFMVLTNVNKFVVIGFGMFVLNEAKTWQAYVGCTIALSGGLLYARVRSSQSSPALPKITPGGAGGGKEASEPLVKAPSLFGCERVSERS
mmetsp:Transcript_24564/g.55917  ORF Transcript_24564/g.55917 Transcript_24564/m.55917 type:complete len:169 (-) Transcript_24564:202-708(-)